MSEQVQDRELLLRGAEFRFVWGGESVAAIAESTDLSEGELRAAGKQRQWPLRRIAVEAEPYRDAMVVLRREIGALAGAGQWTRAKRQTAKRCNKIIGLLRTAGACVDRLVRFVELLFDRRALEAFDEGERAHLVDVHIAYVRSVIQLTGIEDVC